MSDEPRSEDRPRVPPMSPYPQRVPPRFMMPGEEASPGRVPDDVAQRLEQALQHDSSVEIERRDPLDDLAKLISEPPRAPPIGVQAATGMERLFDAVAKEMEAAAEDGVRRAEAVRQDVLSYTTVLRETGRLLSEEIVAKAAMTGKLHLGIQILREAFPGVPAREPGA